MVIEEISFEDMMSLAKQGRTVLVDVRTAKEYEKKHCEGAINISKEEIDEIISDEDEIIKKLRAYSDEGKMIILYCKTGNRSIICARTLLDYDIRCLCLREGIENQKID